MQKTRELCLAPSPLCSGRQCLVKKTHAVILLAQKLRVFLLDQAEIPWQQGRRGRLAQCALAAPGSEE